MAAGYRYIEHTADVEFIAYGPNFKAALENAATALLNTMFDIKKLKKVKSKVKTIRITEEATDRNNLVWFMLQKIVSTVDEKGVQAFKFRINRMSEAKGKIKVHGCVFYKRTDEYLSLFDVKGVTPYDLKIRQKGKGFEISVVVDV